MFDVDMGQIMRKLCFLYIWDSFRENVPPRIYIKPYKNALRLNHYNPRTTKASDLQFSPIHTTPPLHRTTHSGVPNRLPAIVARSDTPRGPRPPHPQVEAPKSPQNRCIRRGIPQPLNCSVRQSPLHPSRRYSHAKSMHTSRQTRATTAINPRSRLPIRNKSQ